MRVRVVPCAAPSGAPPPLSGISEALPGQFVTGIPAPRPAAFGRVGSPPAQTDPAAAAGYPVDPAVLETSMALSLHTTVE
eukprot:7712834-Pyramimonas_sp.AAC.1